MGAQAPQMMDSSTFNNRASPMGHGAPANHEYMVGNSRDILAGVSQQGMMNDSDIAGGTGMYGQGRSDLFGPHHHYDPVMQPQDVGMGGVVAGYADPAYVMRHPHMSNLGHHAAMRSPNHVHIRNTMDGRNLTPLDAASRAHAEMAHDTATTVIYPEHLQMGNVAHGGGSMVVQGHRAAATMNDDHLGGLQSTANVRVQVSHDVGENMDSAGGRHSLFQMVPQPNQHVPRQETITVPTDTQLLSTPDVMTPITLPQAVDTSQQVPGAAQGSTGIQLETQAAPDLADEMQSESRSRPSLNLIADRSNEDTMFNGFEAPHTKKQAMLQLFHQGNVNSTTGGPSRQLSPQNTPTVQSKAQNENEYRTFVYSKQSNESKDVASMHTADALATKRRVFFINSKWKLIQPGQMLYFEFCISYAAYKDISVFVDNLMAPSSVRCHSDQPKLQIFDRADLQVVVKDKFEVNPDTISDTAVENILEGLKGLKCAIVKRGIHRKVILKGYPERGCVVYSTVNNHELQCFFGSTAVENNVNLTLYHKVTCDHNPTFVSSRENRRHKAVLERSCDLYMEAPGYRVQLVLRRLADTQGKSYQVSFGASANDIVDFIMHMFNETPPPETACAT
ncbi:type I methionyl aminopeptidase [Babesia caballi]|uniref:Type I methionyl aminopeptidase n=1 Tax=Babesia caballi TaxID=5871 RepID=A0AAV4LWM6_BABCB|nr:type I methionyl aminopeptidase [Babesia caballi]